MLNTFRDAKALADTVFSVAKKTGNIEMEEKSLELREKILELGAENLDLRSEISDLMEEIKTLKKSLDNKDRLKFDGLVYEKNDSEYKFCPNCYDDKGKAIHLIKDSHGYDCRTCNKFFALESFSNRQTVIVETEYDPLG